MLYKLLLFALLVTVYGGLKRVDVAPAPPSTDVGSFSHDYNRPQPQPRPLSGRGQVVHPVHHPQCPIRNPSYGPIRNPNYEAWYNQFKRKGWDFSSDKGDRLLRECIHGCSERNNQLWTCNAYERFKLSFVDCLKHCLSTGGLNTDFLLSDAFDAFNPE